MASDDNEPTKEQLWNRIERLEEHVFPDRRTVLKGAAVAGSSAALGFGAGQATAQSSEQTGQVGTSSSPVDVHGDDVRANTVLNEYRYPFAYTAGYATSVDPANYANDAAALQALVDDVASSGTDSASGRGDETAHVIIPALKPDGTEWSIGSTVDFVDSGKPDRPVLPHGIGFEINRTINVTITDGSPAFRIGPAGTPTPKTVVPFGQLSFDLGGGDCEAMRVRNFVGAKIDGVMVTNAGDTTTADGTLVIDGATFGHSVDNFYYFGGTSNTDVINHVDDTADGPPGNGEISPSTIISGTCNTGYRFDSLGPRVHVGGHIEGASGPAAIYHTATAYVGVTPYLYLGGNSGSSTTDAIQDNSSGGGVIVASGCDLGSPARHGIYINNSGGFQVGHVYITPGSGSTVLVDSAYNAQVASRLPAGAEVRGTVTDNSGDANIVQNNVS